MGPLTNLKVVEMGFAVAGPIAATLLADFGADVIKVEEPGKGDGLRNMGPKKDGLGIWWLVAARNKRSVAIDLKTGRGREVLHELLDRADVLIENFRPGVLERMGLDAQTLNERFPRLIVLRVSGFGQTGPYSPRPGFGKLAEAYSGATNLTGEAGSAPLHPSYSLGDVVCALHGAFGVMMALHARTATGRGQVIDLALYEPLFRLIEWQLPLHEIAGTHVMRNGPRFPFPEAFLTDICRTRDGDHVVVSAATPSHLERVAALLREHGVQDDLSSTPALGDALRRWIAERDCRTVLDAFAARDLVSGLVYTPADMLEDPHMAARGNVVRLKHPVLGEIPMPNVVPLLRDTPGAVRWAGPALGQHTEEVLREVLGMRADEIEALRRERVI